MLPLTHALALMRYGLLDNASGLHDIWGMSNTTTEACQYGQASCTVCNSTCKTGAGVTSFCGDGRTDSNAGETCDDGNAATETCPYGQASCMVCDASCRTVPGATSVCGDSAVDSAAGEACDDGNAVTEACAYGQVSCNVCDAAAVGGRGQGPDPVKRGDASHERGGAGHHIRDQAGTVFTKEVNLAIRLRYGLL